LTLPDNLSRTNPLKPEAAAQTELDGLRRSGLMPLKDAANASLSVSSLKRQHVSAENTKWLKTCRTP